MTVSLSSMQPDAPVVAAAPAAWRPGRRCASTRAETSGGIAVRGGGGDRVDGALEDGAPSLSPTPLVRVSALKSRMHAIRASRAARPASSPSPAGCPARRGARGRAPRWSGPPASRRAGTRRSAPRGPRPRCSRAPATIADARRLPNVIVPVLSSRITSTSPAASTARPAHRQDVEAGDAVHARDADRGQQPADGGRDEAHQQRDQRHDRAPRARVDRERPQRDGREQEHEGQAGQQDRRARSRSGVFWRLAPSTSAIIRSRKVSPGFGGDPDDERVGDDRRAAGDAASGCPCPAP